MSRSFNTEKRGKFPVPTISVIEHADEITATMYHNSNTCSVCIVNGSQYSKDVRALLSKRGRQNV